MLPSKQRLSREVFDNHYKKARRFHGEFVSLLVSEAEAFCGSVVVGKKVYKEAVKRNRLRRRLYGLLVPYARRVSAVCIVLTKDTAGKVPYVQVREDLKKLTEKAFPRI